MQRIAIMLPRLSQYGGVEQFAYRLSAALARKGYAVDYICARQECPAPEGVEVRCVGRVGGTKFLKMLWFLVRAELLRRRGNYDLCLSLGKNWNQDLVRVGGGPLRNFWAMSEKAWPAGSTRLFKKIRRYCAPSNWLTLLVEARQYSGKSRMVCVSEAVSRWSLSEHPNCAPKIIYNLPDLSHYAPAHAEEKALARSKFPDIFADIPDALCISTASSNFMLKGIPQLIDALPALPMYHLLVAGGRASADLVARARTLNVQERVHFLGRVDDMRSLYHASDFFVLASFYDACSNAVLEAVACGVPTLSTVTNGSSVFLPPDQVLGPDWTVADLAQGIQHLAAKKECAPLRVPQGLHTGIPAWLELIDEMMKER